jgi:CheY-like chemotaxis protein
MENGKSHIVIVDDDSLTCMLLSDILTNTGYKTTTISNGADALAFIRSNSSSIDVIILDRIMPELSGIEVLHKLCAIPIARNIPVIMLTSRAETTHVDTAFMLGVFEFLYKPINENALIKAVNDALTEKATHIYE